MFTGIIEEVGSILTISKFKSYKQLTVKADIVLDKTVLGDSIAINGVCQTVIEIGNNSFKVDVLEQSLLKTNLNFLSVNSCVNLERAITLDRPFGGHFVQGHVQDVGVVSGIKEINKNIYLSVKIPKSIRQYVVNEGSITVDGISLTVAKINNLEITINVIPHTKANSIIKNYRVGSSVNLEPDMLIKSLFSNIELPVTDQKEKGSVLTKEKLLSWGY